MSFIASKFDHKIPQSHQFEPIDIQYIEEIRQLVNEYVQKLELVKIKDGLKIAMAASSVVNNYIQTTEAFKLFKTNKERSETIYNLTSNLLVVIAVLLEPFMPSFSAKVYQMLNIE